MDTVYSIIANRIAAIANCQKNGNDEWIEKHTDAIEQIVRDFLPSGSGWDNGTQIDLGRCTSNKLVFTGSYHHMDESGGYDGWTDHTITIRPDLVSGITIDVSGRNRNDIKDYLADLFSSSLWDQIEYDGSSGRFVSRVPQVS